MAKPFETPRVPSEREQVQAKRCLEQLTKRQRIRIMSADRVSDAERERTGLDLPEPAGRLLKHILEELAQGHAVTLLSVHAELTTQEAADYLQVSRPFLIGLLDRGEIPHRKVGRHRRVLASDLQAYMDRSMPARQQALKKLVRQGQKHDLGY